MHLGKFAGHTEFQSWVVNFSSRSLRRGEESRARVTEDQENRSNQLAEDLNPKSILVKDFSDCEELDLMMAAELKWSCDIAYLVYEITERRAVARQKGEKLVHRAQEWRKFSAEDNWVLFKKRRLVVFYTRVPRETVRTTWDEVERRKKFSPRASILFSTESEGTDWRKSLYSLKASLATKAQKSLSIAGKIKKHCVTIDIIPCVVVTSLEQMHIWLSLPVSTCWWWEETQQEVEKKVLICCFSERKKRPRLCVFRLRSNEFFPLRVEKLGLGASAGDIWNSQDALGTKLNSGNKKAIWVHYPTKWTSRAKSLRAGFWGTTTWGNLTTSRLYQQSSVEFGEKYECSEPKTATFYSLVKEPETQKIVCLLWIRELRCTMLSKGNLSSDTMNTLTWSKNPWATYRDQVQCK